MGNITRLLVDLLDIITNETSIEVKDTKGNYFDFNQVMLSLSKIWNTIDYDKKIKIGKMFVECFLNYDINKVKYEKLSKSTRTLPLISIIYPEEDTAKSHIIYDRIEHKFVLSDKISDEKFIDGWHFKSAFTNIENVIDLLNDIKIKPFSFLRDFLLQNIKIQEIYLETNK